MAFEYQRLVNGSKSFEIITPAHKMDAFNGGDIKAHIKDIEPSIDAFIIDFSRTAYIDSSGLREMIQILKLLQNSYKELYIVGVSDDIARIFFHANLYRLFIFCVSVADAVEVSSNYYRT